jgi:hypothetical protein
MLLARSVRGGTPIAIAHFTICAALDQKPHWIGSITRHCHVPVAFNGQPYLWRWGQLFPRYQILLAPT